MIEGVRPGFAQKVKSGPFEKPPRTEVGNLSASNECCRTSVSSKARSSCWQAARGATCPRTFGHRAKAMLAVRSGAMVARTQPTNLPPWKMVQLSQTSAPRGERPDCNRVTRWLTCSQSEGGASPSTSKSLGSDSACHRPLARLGCCFAMWLIMSVRSVPGSVNEKKGAPQGAPGVFISGSAQSFACLPRCLIGYHSFLLVR